MFEFSNLFFYNTKFIKYHNQGWACALKKKEKFENHLGTMTVKYNEGEKPIDWIFWEKKRKEYIPVFSKLKTSKGKP